MDSNKKPRNRSRAAAISCARPAAPARSATLAAVAGQSAAAPAAAAPSGAGAGDAGRLPRDRTHPSILSHCASTGKHLFTQQERIACPSLRNPPLPSRVRANGATNALQQGLARAAKATIKRRSFLVRAGLTAGAAGMARHLPFNVIDTAEAQEAAVAAAAAPVTKHTVCTHCSVGCSVEAVVSNGVWIRQEPAFDSPFNMGAHCAKGASVREHGHGEHRLRYPMKLVAGKYVRISWEQAINEVGDSLLALRAESPAPTPS